MALHDWDVSIRNDTSDKTNKVLLPIDVNGKTKKNKEFWEILFVITRLHSSLHFFLFQGPARVQLSFMFSAHAFEYFFFSFVQFGAYWSSNIVKILVILLWFNLF